MMASGTGNSGEISFKILGVGGDPAFEQNVTLELARKEIPRSERLLVRSYGQFGRRFLV